MNERFARCRVESDDEDFTEAANDLMGDTTPGCAIAWEAITESDEAAEALAVIIRDYDDSEDGALFNHQIVSEFIGYVRQYCEEYAEKNQ